MTQIKTVCVDKVAYEAVLRNSIRVNDLEAENQQLKELLYKCREKLDELDYGCEVWQGELTGFIEEIDNAIGEKK